MSLLAVPNLNIYLQTILDLYKHTYLQFRRSSQDEQIESKPSFVIRQQKLGVHGSACHYSCNLDNYKEKSCHLNVHGHFTSVSQHLTGTTSKCRVLSMLQDMSGITSSREQ